MQISSVTLLRAAPLAITLVWLFVDSPAMFATEVQFAAQVLLISALTRSIDVRTGLLAFTMGVGIVAPLVTLFGTALTYLGVDVDNDAGNWLVVPILEEALKLLPACWLAWRQLRRTSLPFNASDWLVTAALGGAGFAMVENAYLSHHDLVYRYGPQIGPLYLFPTAWGYAGYLGHGAATAVVGLGIGIATAAPLRAALRQWWWTPAVACFAWITLEHGLANMFYSETSRSALALGAGRATPTLFLVLLALALALDAVRARQTWRASPKLRTAMSLAWAAVRESAARPSKAVRTVGRLLLTFRLLNRVATMPVTAFEAPATRVAPEVRT